jgi:hypothetical protein
MKKKKCQCCWYYTLDMDSFFGICPVCYWEEDAVQNDDINYAWWANGPSLKEARENYKNFGASEILFKDSVRPPLEEEKVNL